MEKPVVAAVRGPVAGIGFSLAMCCDLVIASDTAYFQQSFRNVGLVPDGGAALFLTQRLGVGRAKDLVFTARRLRAAEALDWGLVSQVVPDDELEDRSMAVARDLAAGPTLMMAIAKKMLALASQPTLETMLEFESCAQGVARESEDHREGVEAFKEKRKPVFKGS
jgi:2-(1,2-epoxy-1,2-dihydrophenyl)acetyl-CoA isomerase